MLRLAFPSNRLAFINLSLFLKTRVNPHRAHPTLSREFSAFTLDHRLVACIGAKRRAIFILDSALIALPGTFDHRISTHVFSN